MAKLPQSPAPSPQPSLHPQPDPRPLTRPQRLVVLAERLARTLAIARALAQTGRHVDLTGIEDGVGMLCAQTLDMSFDEGQHMLPLLHELVGQVDALTAALRTGQPPPYLAVQRSPASPSRLA